MNQQVGTKQVLVDGKLVTVRVFAAKSRRTRNEDTLHAGRMADVRYQCTPADVQEWLEERAA